ncbi:MAG: hypothetical protein C0505_02155 [Leptothrix sp. (in: Bacteria)]|nr:hypothetical protein [Leptothrix sp. (in: b-proteobacteria)]
MFTWLSFGSALPSKVAQFSVGANTTGPVGRREHGENRLNMHTRHRFRSIRLQEVSQNPTHNRGSRRGSAKKKAAQWLLFLFKSTTYRELLAEWTGFESPGATGCFRRQPTALHPLCTCRSGRNRRFMKGGSGASLGSNTCHRVQPFTHRRRLPANCSQIVPRVRQKDQRVSRR